MKIRELYLRNFGKFSNEKITFHDGVNLFYGENESGKSTVHTFIKSMLFGLERGRGRASINDTFSRYEPWENPNYYSGCLKFESGGKIFSLDRTFDKYSKRASLICESDGEELSLEHGDLELLLDGLDMTSYENTIAVGQMKIEPNQNLISQLQDYAANYYTTGDGDIDLEKALNLLNERKKEVEKAMRVLTQERQQKRAVIEQEAGYAWRDIHRFETDLEELEERIEVQEKKFAEQEANVEKKWRIHPWMFVGMALSLIIAFFALNPPWGYLVTIVLLLAYLLFIWNRVKDGKINSARGTFEEAGAALHKLQGQREQIQNELKDKQIYYNNLQEQIAEQEEADDGYGKLVQRKQALELAYHQLKSLTQDVYQDFSRDLNRKTSEILNQITGGKYSMLQVDEKLKMSLFTEGRRIGIEQVSRGTIEQIYFSLRMAVCDILYEEEYPVILDDTFVFYDDVRLENTLKWLIQNKKQIIIFTCQKREGEILKKLGAL